MAQIEAVGTVMIALVTIVGLFITVGKPIIDLNKNLIEINLTIKTIEKTQLSYESDNTKSHGRIWDKLDDHDTAIKKTEKDIFATKEQLAEIKGKLS